VTQVTQVTHMHRSTTGQRGMVPCYELWYPANMALIEPTNLGETPAIAI
jgi:hypothetical protein